MGAISCQPLVQSKDVNREVESDDIVTAVFRFKSTVIVTGMWCFSIDKISERDITRIVGSEGELTYNSFGSPMIIRVESTLNGNEEFIFNHAQPI